MKLLPGSTPNLNWIERSTLLNEKFQRHHPETPGSFPHCESWRVVADRQAGYDPLHLVRAGAAHCAHLQEREGGRDDPWLGPLLACLIE